MVGVTAWDCDGQSNFFLHFLEGQLEQPLWIHREKPWLLPHLRLDEIALDLPAARVENSCVVIGVDTHKSHEKACSRPIIMALTKRLRLVLGSGIQIIKTRQELCIRKSWFWFNKFVGIHGWYNCSFFYLFFNRE